MTRVWAERARTGRVAESGPTTAHASDFALEEELDFTGSRCTASPLTESTCRNSCSPASWTRTFACSTPRGR